MRNVVLQDCLSCIFLVKHILLCISNLDALIVINNLDKSFNSLVDRLEHFFLRKLLQIPRLKGCAREICIVFDGEKIKQQSIKFLLVTIPLLKSNVINNIPNNNSGVWRTIH